MNSPVIFYYGNTVVKAGETVVIRGEFLDELKSLILSNGEKSISLPALQLNRQSVKVIIPQDFNTAGNYELQMDFGCKKIRLSLNAPKIRWVQGDEGSIATSNGWLRVNGEKLRVVPNIMPYAKIINKTTSDEITLIASEVYDDYSVRFDFAGLANGEYLLQYCNGFDYDSVDFSIDVSPKSKWNQAVYNVRDYGLTDDLNTDCTESLRRLLQVVKNNGGGTIYFPKGRYLLSEGLIDIPKGVTLKGDGVSKTAIIFKDVWKENRKNSVGVMQPFPSDLPAYMFGTDGDLCINGIFFLASRMGDFLRAGSRWNRAKNIYIDNIRIYANATEGAWVQSRKSNAAELASQQITFESRMATVAETVKMKTNVFRINGENVHISNSELMCSGMPLANEAYNDYLHIHNVQFRGETRIENWLAFGYVYNAIVEDNYINRYTTGASGSNLYFSRNSISNAVDYYREGFTTDLDEAMPYFGSAIVHGKTVVFPETVPMDGKLQVGCKVCILQGRGAGQYRKVTKIDGTVFTIESEFEVAPDESSVLTVNTLLCNWYMCSNVFDNTSCLSSYVPQCNWVVDGTKLTRTPWLQSNACVAAGGWFNPQTLLGRAHHQWYVSFVNNDMSDSFCRPLGFDSKWRGAISARTMGESLMGTVLLNIACMIRNNRLSDDSVIVVASTSTDGGIVATDMLVENNIIQDSICDGIIVEGVCDRFLLKGNSFYNVSNEIDIAQCTNPDEIVIIQ